MITSPLFPSFLPSLIAPGIPIILNQELLSLFHYTHLNVFNMWVWGTKLDADAVYELNIINPRCIPWPSAHFFFITVGHISLLARPHNQPGAGSTQLSSSHCCTCNKKVVIHKLCSTIVRSYLLSLFSFYRPLPRTVQCTMYYINAAAITASRLLMALPPAPFVSRHLFLPFFSSCPHCSILNYIIHPPTHLPSGPAHHQHTTITPPVHHYQRCINNFSFSTLFCTLYEMDTSCTRTLVPSILLCTVYTECDGVWVGTGWKWWSFYKSTRAASDPDTP